MGSARLEIDGMYALTLVAQKGGTGKTTLAINLSIAAEASLATQPVPRPTRRASAQGSR